LCIERLVKECKRTSQVEVEMNSDFDDIDEDQYEQEEKGIDWSQYAQEEEQALRPLDGKDYIALFIASLQTIFLPLIILMIVMLTINFFLQIAAG
jgi:hypothetical protein